MREFYRRGGSLFLGNERIRVLIHVERGVSPSVHPSLLFEKKKPKANKGEGSGNFFVALK